MEETCDIVKRVIIKIKKFFNIIKIEIINKNIIYYLPIYKNNKISKYRIKKLCNKINRLLEEEGVSTVVLSEYLRSNKLLKNYLYFNNINILNGRYLFKCLIYKIVEKIYIIKNRSIESRGNININ